MKPADILREIGYPLGDTGVLFAMIGFLLLGRLALAAGLLGIWLGIVILPAFFRYLLVLLGARSERREAPPPGIELFNWVGDPAGLLPLLVFGLAAWAGLALARQGSTGLAMLVVLPLVLLLPASLAILAMTRSPLESLNPFAWLRLIRLCGRDYLLAPMLALLLAAGARAAAGTGVPALLVQFVDVYAGFLLVTLTGAVVADSGAVSLVSIPDAAEPGEEERIIRETRERRIVLDHAYGFVSRGNLDGGLAHLDGFIARSPHPADDYRWLFAEMMKWERKQAALFFAQRYLTFLFDSGDETAALKVVSRCLMEDRQFRPSAKDRERLLELAERNRRDDLIRQLGSSD